MKALILVDLQNDFMPGGALAVKEGDAIVPVANRLMPYFELVIVTQDWHPANHLSFASQHPDHGVGNVIQLEGQQQVLWPDHCVQDTQGSKFHHDLNLPGIHRVITKGTDRGIDSYSGFFDNGHKQGTGLAEYLKQHYVTEVYILGLATDYCVKFTALDAISLGLTNYLIEDGCRGVELQAGDVESALEELRWAGVKITSSDEILKGLST